MAVTFDKQIGTRIKEYRERVGLSQERLAELMKIARVTVSQIESGARKLTAQETAELARVFNTSSDALLDIGQDISVVFEQAGDEETGELKETFRISVPQKNIAKFKEVLLYVLNKVGSRPNIGQTVLYKLLYFIDFDYYEKYEEQLIGATYKKNHYGPTPVEFSQLVKRMEGRELAKCEDQYFKYPRTKYLPLRDPDLSVLSARELDMINEVLDKLGHMNAVQISEYSHGDVPWLTTENNRIIDYEAVFYRTPPYAVRSYDEEESV